MIPFRSIITISVMMLATLCSPCARAQYDTVSIFNLPIQLDTFVVRKGFDVSAFVKRVQTDTTFFKAFKNMRFVPYTAVNDILVLDKKGRISASLHSTTRQERANNCRVTKVLEQRTTGDFFKRNGSYNYYTAELFAYLFFAPKPVCNETDVVTGSMIERGSGLMEKRKYELKQLIFNPGGKIQGIPFVGDRESIFDPDEARKYDFRIRRDTVNTIPCYVFSITPKQGFEKKVIYDELTTWFRISDYSIIARNYSLSYSTMLYDFNVRMQVRTSQLNDKLYPTYIGYDGNWHIFSQKRERVRFTVNVAY